MIARQKSLWLLLKQHKGHWENKNTFRKSFITTLHNHCYRKTKEKLKTICSHINRVCNGPGFITSQRKLWRSEIKREFSKSDFQKALWSNSRPVYRGDTSSRPLQKGSIQSEAPSDRLNLHRGVTHLEKAQVLHLHLLREEWKKETSERTCN